MSKKFFCPPQADFTFNPPTPKIEDEVFFDASGSNDEGITSYEWFFGDGSTGSGEVVTHTYSVAGSYTVKLTVKDDDGLIDTCTKKVSVEEDDEPEEDTDDDGIPDSIDLDDDDDGWSDEEENEYGADPKNPDDHPENSNEDADSDEDQGEGSHSAHKSRRHHLSRAESPRESDNLEEETRGDSNVSALSYVLQHWSFDDSQNQYTNTTETLQ